QHELVGIEAVGTLAADALDLGAAQARLDGADHGERDLILDGEQIADGSVVSLSPDIRPVCSISELCVDAEAIGVAPHAALQNIANAELAADLLEVGDAAPPDEAGIARDHEQPPDTRQPGDDVIDHTIGEPARFAELLERQHGDRRLFGDRQRSARPGLVRARFETRYRWPGITIAAPRQRLDPASSIVLLERTAECCDLHREIAVLDIEPRPRRLDQRALADDGPGALQQYAQQRGSALAEQGRSAAATQRASLGIECKGAELVSVG